MRLTPRLSTAALLLPLALSGCTHLFFQPSSHLFVKPESVGARYDTIRFASADGTPLTGMFFPALKTPAKGTVIHFHGNGENMTSHFGYSYWLANYGYNVFIFDYRGYGASGGSPSVAGAVQDGVAALRWVRERPGVDSGRLIVFGQSLGAALALASTAADRAGVRAVVLESPFSSFRSIARDKLSHIFLLGLLSRPLAWLLISDAFSPRDTIPRLAGIPILIIHGDADPVVPIEEGKALFTAAREPKQFWTVAGGSHTEAFTRFAAQYRPRLVDYLERTVP